MIPVHIIGLGMSPDDLTPKALQLIETAEVLAGGRRHLDYFASHRGERIVVGGDLTGALKAIQEAAAGRQVVVLASGDPNFYGIGRRLTEFLGPGKCGGASQYHGGAERLQPPENLLGRRHGSQPAWPGHG